MSRGRRWCCGEQTARTSKSKSALHEEEVWEGKGWKSGGLVAFFSLFSLARPITFQGLEGLVRVVHLTLCVLQPLAAESDQEVACINAYEILF